MRVNCYFKDSEYTIEILKTKKIIDLKNKIIKMINETEIKYIDLKFICENPIRSFGQQTINPGIISRTWDNMSLDNYPLESKNLRIEIIKVEDYSTTENIQQKSQKKPMNRFKKFGRKNEMKPKPEKITFDYDIDFPPLGS